MCIYIYLKTIFLAWEWLSRLSEWMLWVQTLVITLSFLFVKCFWWCYRVCAPIWDLSSVDLSWEQWWSPSNIFMFFLGCCIVQEFYDYILLLYQIVIVKWFVLKEVKAGRCFLFTVTLYTEWRFLRAGGLSSASVFTMFHSARLQEKDSLTHLCSGNFIWNWIVLLARWNGLERTLHLPVYNDKSSRKI